MIRSLEEVKTWPLWECISRETLVKLIQYQWDHFGTRLELLITAPYSELEPLEEIDRIMRRPPKYKRIPGKAAKE